MDVDEIRARAGALVADGPSEPVIARDPVNLPMINNWVEAIGDENPIYISEEAARAAGHDGIVAPPAMLQVWTMGGMKGAHGPNDPLTKCINLLSDAGYTAVVATNCEQTYERYLYPGERLTMESSLVELSDLKHTSLGEGFFMSSRHVWHSDADEKPVGEMRLRMFKYRPGPPTQDGGRSRSVAVPDEGTPLPEMKIHATPTFIIASAIATRDFQDVHHDRDAAQGYGAKDIFVNILTDTGLVERFATDWAGANARVHEVALRLRVPCYAYDTLTFQGASTRDTSGEDRVAVAATGQLGIHLTGSVRLTR